MYRDFSNEKDHYTTLKAFKIVLRKIKNVKLILIGYGPELKNIIRFAKNLKINKNIIVINKTYNPYSYMKKSKLLILTSVYEGFPNVLVESLTIGTPVISTNANAGASEILLNGKGGDLIRIGDYKNLAKKIIRHFSYPKILIKKAKIAEKIYTDLKQSDIVRSIQIYFKEFNENCNNWCRFFWFNNCSKVERTAYSTSLRKRK